MGTFRKVSEVVAILSDKGFCAPHVIEKDGMGGGKQKYVEWHEVVRMMDEVFGPFGWDAVPTTSFTDLERGVFIYDGYMVARAVDDETGQVLELKRAGRGMGAAKAVSDGAVAEIDRQGHGAKSDFYSNTSKALGDGFGLYLYPKKGAPASTGAAQGGSAPQASGDLSTLMSRAPQAPAKSGYIGNVSPAQAGKARANGWNDDQLKRLLPAEVKQVMDGLFGKGQVVPVPGSNTRQASGGVTVPPTEIENLILEDSSPSDWPL